MHGAVAFDGRPAILHGPAPTPRTRWDVQMVGEVRLDNRRELADTLHVPPATLADTTDLDLAFAAFVRWGRDCPRHLHGDWSIAVWDAAQRRLFLARDHLGNTALFYSSRHSPIFAFASCAAEVPALAGARAQMDDVYVAEYIAGLWTTDVPDRTAYKDVRQLLPGTCATVTDRDINVSTYWRLFESPPVRLPTDTDYADALLVHLRSAVASRLPASGLVGATLSSGLDSGIVTVLAAEALHAQGRNLTALTAVPAVPASALPANADEWPGAQRVAARHHNITHVAIRGDTRTPTGDLSRALDVLKQPQHAVSNFGWILQMLEEAHARGVATLLTGQLGNGSISWNGGTPVTLRSMIRPLLHHLSARRPLRADASVAPLLHPDVARVVQIADRARLSRLRAHAWPPLTQRAQRVLTLSGLAAGTGPFWSRLGAAHELRVCDPTTDVRLVEFCAGLPPEQHVRDGVTRVLIRRAAAGLLPDDIRHTTTKGRQGTDLAPRLLTHRRDVDGMVAALTGSRVLNHDAVVQLWQRLQRSRDPAEQRRHAPMLMRGLMAGLFDIMRA